MEPLQTPTSLNTRSGLLLDFADPDPGAITIEDIAAGLAMAPRFGGQALSFHSVAQHAVNVSILVMAQARSLGIDRRKLYRLIEKYALDPNRPSNGQLQATASS